MGHVYVTDPIAPEALGMLTDLHNVSLGYGPASKTWEEVQDSIDAALVRSQTISGDQIRNAPKLKILARHGVGTDSVDLQAAAQCGVIVTTTPGGNSRAVAEHVFALILTLVRHTSEAANRVRNGIWIENRGELLGAQLENKVFLLVGAGNIPRQIAPIAQGFGMRLLVHDPFVDAEKIREMGAEKVELDDVLGEVDFLSLHVPKTPATTHLINDARLTAMKSSAIVINTARGGVLDEDALVEHLSNGSIAGGALDVIEAEKFDMNCPLPYAHIDLDTPNLIVTPHIAGQTTESLQQVGIMAAESIIAVLNGEPAPHALDLAQLSD